MNQIDLRSLSRAHQILLGCGVVLLIDMFFTWQGLSLFGNTVGVSGWHGLNGVLLGLFTVALVVWELSLALGERVAHLRGSIPLEEKLVSAGLAGGVLVLGVLKFLTAHQLRRWPEWVGLILAIAIGYGGWLVFSKEETLGSVARVPSS